MCTSSSVPAWQLPDEALRAEVAACERRVRAAQARMLDLLAEADERGLAGRVGYRDTVAWLGVELHVAAREATHRLELATAPDLAPARAALAAGEVSREHLTQLHRMVAHCPDHVADHDRQESVRIVLELARQAKPDAVRAAARRILGPAPAESPERRNRFEHCHDPQGWVRFTGRLDPETAALLDGLFGPLAKPRDRGDPRATAERHGDALAEIIGLAARVDELAVQGGERAVLTVTTTLEDLQRRLTDTILDLPGIRTVADTRRLACQAAVLPAIFSAAGEPLYLGREQRLASRAQRRALAIRDRGCTWPGCPRNPKWTIAHHIHEWSRGGRTDIDQMVLICPEHHRTLHATDWQVRLVDHHAEYLPPTAIDPHRKPLRNLVHNTGPPHQNLAA